MPEHKVGTREEWKAAHQALVEKENELAERSRELTEQRQALPWVPVETEYEFETEEGTKNLAELLDAGLVHLNHRDVTFVAISRAPFDRIQAYKQRMGWTFPWVSSGATDYQLDFGFALTEEQQQTIPQVRQMVEEPPDWLQ